MSDRFQTLSSEDLLGALATAQEAVYLWTPSDDRLIWAADAGSLLQADDLTNCSTGHELRQLYRAGDMNLRDGWVADNGHRRSFTGTHRLGPLDDALWVEERLIRIDDAEAGVPQYLGMLRNVSAMRQEIEKLTYIARFDELTGHLSRAHMRTVLARQLLQTRESARTICFGLIGVDNMAGVNSAFGYDIADTVLVSVGSEIASRLGPRDVLARLGSSKFAVIFEDCNPNDLAPRLTMIQTAIRDTIVETGAGPVAVTVSAAGVVLPDDAATTHDAFAAAEDTLTQAKEIGVNQVLIHTTDDSVSARRRNNIALADDLVAAMREERLRLAYQPVVRADDPTQVAFHECLLRLIDRSGKLINAGAFMGVAEKLGLVRMLDKCVLKMAFDTLAKHPLVRLSVNLSPQSLNDSSWLATFDQLASATPSALDRLILEVTEATAIEDAERMARTLNGLRERGCAVALDDFGAGYTSFQQFKSLQLDIVKIDGSYVRGVTESPGDQIFVRTLSELARNHELLVVAEMVDSDEAGELLHSLGVDCFQGFHFGMPEVEPDWLKGGDADRIVRAVG